MKRFLIFMSKYKEYAISSPMLMISEVIIDILLPYLMAQIVDVGISNKDSELILKPGLLLFVITSLSILFGILSAVFSVKARPGFTKDLRLKIFFRIQDFSFENLDHYSVATY